MYKTDKKKCSELLDKLSEYIPQNKLGVDITVPYTIHGRGVNKYLILKDITMINTIRFVPAQDVPYALILWYVLKIIYSS